MKLRLEIDVSIVEEFVDDSTAIARVHYPDEGNCIEIVKGLNTIELSTAIFHEIGHLVDWYVSNSNQCKSVGIREANADIIGDCLRFKRSS